jgi:hypothetical protein
VPQPPFFHDLQAERLFSIGVLPIHFDLVFNDSYALIIEKQHKA